MDERDAASARRVLHVLADLAPSAEQAGGGLSIPTDWFRWLSLETVRVLGQPPPSLSAFVDRDLGDQLAAVGQLRPGHTSLRVGWLFVTGRLVVAGEQTRRVLHPLVTIPVRVVRSPLFGPAQLVAAGDAAVSDLVADPVVRDELERTIEVGGGELEGQGEVALDGELLSRLTRLAAYAERAADAAGLPARGVIPAGDSPTVLMRQDGLRIVGGVAVYATHETSGMSRAGSLRRWADGPLGTRTALHALYLGAAIPAPGGGQLSTDRVESAFVLTPTQKDAVRRSRRDDITLISGAPGTGKSHAIAAIACDALARGGTVLVAAKSDATVDALLGLLDRAPGPDPVVFGSSERREALATRLASGQLQAVAPQEIATARRHQERAIRARDAAGTAIRDGLLAESLLRGPDELTLARVDFPGLFAAEVDLARARRLAREAARAASGWWARRRATRSLGRLRAVADADPATSAAELQQAVDTAVAAHAASTLVASGGLRIGAGWDELRRLDDAARVATGTWLAMDGRSERRLARSSLAAIGALATALRSGRAARRAQLAGLDAAALTRALPLWVGTLGDVDDLLPPRLAQFDLVILDEASSIDQPLAAPALLRAARAVIAGDPRQLRHVSFLSDDQHRTAIAAHDLGSSPVLAARLDVRRNSVFDVAAGVAPVLVLAEHFRSHPHLVDFVARRLYDGALQVATRSPRTESVDCIDVTRVQGSRDSAGAIAAEVTEVLALLRSRLDAHAQSVGVVTPFRAQADALEAAALRAFTIDELEALDLRIGTVHSFQGNERDEIIATVGIGPDDGSSWRFAEDARLLAVLLTRARQRCTVVLSADPPPGGLLDAYLAQADAPPGPPPDGAPRDPWTELVAADLRSAGIALTTGYPTGRHTVDISVGDAARAFSIDCSVHADGPGAHIRRHLALMRGGWTVLGAFPSRWQDRRGELVVELLQQLRPPSP